MRDSIIKNKLKIYSFLFWIVVWSILGRVINNPILFPDPFSVMKSLFNLLFLKEFYLSIINSLVNIGLGLILGIILGLILAIISYKNTILKEIIMIPINIIKSIPIASIVIILLVWFTSKSLPIMVVMLIVVPTIYFSAYEGFINVDTKILELSKVFCVDKKKIIKFVYLDKLREFLYPSIVLSTGLAFKSGVSAEVIALVKNSIGENIYYSKLYLDTQDLFAWTIVIILLSKVCEKIITKLLIRVK